MAGDIRRGNDVRMTILIVLLAMAGCGSNSGLAGKESKHGTPVRIERLGTMTTAELVEERSCHPKQIHWCANRAGRQQCECVFPKRVENRVRRLTGQYGDQAGPPRL